VLYCFRPDLNSYLRRSLEKWLSMCFVTKQKLHQQLVCLRYDRYFCPGHLTLCGIGVGQFCCVMLVYTNCTKMCAIVTKFRAFIAGARTHACQELKVFLSVSHDALWQCHLRNTRCYKQGLNRMIFLGGK